MVFNMQREEKKNNKNTNNDGWTARLSANFSAGTNPVALKIRKENDFWSYCGKNIIKKQMHAMSASCSPRSTG